MENESRIPIVVVHGGIEYEISASGMRRGLLREMRASGGC